MKCAVIVPALRPSEHLSLCLAALLKNCGNDQDIYVVSQDTRCSNVTDLGANVRFVDAQSNIPLPTDALVYKAFLAFDKKYEVLVFQHSDTIVREFWWEKLKELWNEVDRKKIWGIVIPTIQPMMSTDKLSLSWDSNNGDYCNRWTVCNSFLPDIYERTIKKYGSNTYFSVEYLLAHEAILEHKWAMVANNGSFADHLISGLDTNFFNIGEYLNKTYVAFFNSLGYNLEHFMGIWFGTVLINHAHEIIENVNAGTFDKIDYIFDEALIMLNNTDCEHCNTSLKDGRVLRCNARGRARGIHATY